MAVVRDVQRPVDVMKVQVMEESATGKPIYAAGQFRWGAFRDVEDRIGKYWLWGPLRSYAAYLFSVFKDYTWNCSSQLRYTLPCDGCQRCKSPANQPVSKPEQPTRWWQAFVPRAPVPLGNRILFDSLIIFFFLNVPSCISPQILSHKRTTHP